LAIASKNNEADVLEALEHHPDMLLRLPDFAVTQIHWNDKATSLQTIAQELNIGLDALAFFDDSPVERAWVQQRLPEVVVFDVPPDPLKYVETLEASGVFDRFVISDEDRQRADMVQQSRQREQLLAQAGSMEDFLRDLAMTATIGRLGPTTLPRVVQLMAKTNQFNPISPPRAIQGRSYRRSSNNREGWSCGCGCGIGLVIMV
jgi:FkbH-like protein